MYLKNFIKSFDECGHPVQFKFGGWKDRKNVQERVFKTFFGGTLSILANICFFSFFFYYLLIML